MEYQPFIVEVPTGEGQDYCTIFAGALLPRTDDSRPREDERRYGITIDVALIVGQEDLLGKLQPRTNRLNVGSLHKPQIALRHRGTGLLYGTHTAAFLERTFYELHWIGLTPDRVVRYIPKRLFVQPYDYNTPHQKGTDLRLVAVEMDVDDIKASLKHLSAAYQQQQEDRFGA